MDEIKISAIIPTRGDRTASLEILRRDLQEQTLPPHEIIVIEGLPTPGEARNMGAKQAKGDYLLFLDDDASLGGCEVLNQLYSTLETSSDIGLAGAAIAVPPDANRFQKAYAKQFPRSDLDAPDDVTDSDLVTTLCCMMPAELFRRLGGFREDIVAGEDPELRDRIRYQGSRITLAPGVRVFHPPPVNLRGALKRSYWYGRGDAQIKRQIPKESWRRSSRPMGCGRIVLKAAILPLSLFLDLPKLSEEGFRLRWGWIYVLCGYAHILGYTVGRLKH